VDGELTAEFVKRWQGLVPDVRLEVLESPYRSVIQPLLKYLDDVDRREPERGLAVVFCLK